MSLMLPTTTKSRASNAVATSASHGGDKDGSGSGKCESGGGKGSMGKSGGGTELFATSAAMSPMLPTTRSRASNAVATNALYGGGKGGGGSGQGGSSGGTGGSGSGNGGIGGTKPFDASAIMLPMLPTTRSRASNAVATSALHGGGKD